VTVKIGNVVIIEAEEDRVCDRCRQTVECRDVLGDGSSLCFECTTAAERERYTRWLFGEPEPKGEGGAA